jgi:nucleoside-diphosphate-sugar epimerase
VARVLIVGCGCRGQALSRALVADGHAVRGTTRDPGRMEAIRAAGADPYLGDPDRIGTLMDALSGVPIVAWLMGTATGDPERVRALHDGRLRMLWEKLVDTPVRGVVYEAAGSVDPAALIRGEAVARVAHETWRIPLEYIHADPAQDEAWVAAGRTAVDRLLGLSS